MSPITFVFISIKFHNFSALLTSKSHVRTAPYRAKSWRRPLPRPVPFSTQNDLKAADVQLSRFILNYSIVVWQGTIILISSVKLVAYKVIILLGSLLLLRVYDLHFSEFHAISLFKVVSMYTECLGQIWAKASSGLTVKQKQLNFIAYYNFTILKIPGTPCI